jgi:hypothetical protein
MNNSHNNWAAQFSLIAERYLPTGCNVGYRRGAKSFGLLMTFGS